MSPTEIEGYDCSTKSIRLQLSTSLFILYLYKFAYSFTPLIHTFFKLLKCQITKNYSLIIDDMTLCFMVL